MKSLISGIFILSCSLLFSQPSSWTSSGIGGGGSMFSPSISPLDPDVMFVQCDMSEVFQTNNAGLSWQAVPFTELISTGGQHRVEFTSQANILYTVNYSFNEDLRIPVKSLNGGSTWTPLASDPTDGDVWYMSADPGSTERLIIASYDDLFISLDGGETFNLVFDHNADFHIAGVFWDGQTIIVGTQIGLIISTDNGVSFSLESAQGLPLDQGFISFAGARDGNMVRLSGTLANRSDLYPGINALDIDIYSGLMVRNFGVSGWQTATNGIDSDHNLFCLAAARNNTNIIYAGGNDPNTSYPVIYKTTDGGNSWSEVFLTFNNQNISTGYSGYQGDEDWWYGEIVFGLAVAPNNPDVVIYTDFGFAHVSLNGGDSWRQSYVDAADQNPPGSPTPKDKAYKSNGLENTSCWHLHWQSDNSNQIFASYTDITAVRSEDSGQKWAFSYDGINYNTVYHVIEHPETGIYYAAVSSIHDLYQSTYLTDSRIDGGTGGILFSSDHGATWQMLYNFNHPVIWLALDPTNPNRMYASVVHSSEGGIYRTDNLSGGSGSDWTFTSAPPRTEGHPFIIKVLNDGMVVTSWSGRRTSNFTASSGIFTSINQGASWTDVSDGENMWYWTKDIVIDPNDEDQNTWYVAVFSGWGGPANDKGGLYRTTDRGQNWSLIFDSYRVESCTIDPVNPNKIFATTESEGLWYSRNGQEEFPDFTQQTSYTFMHPIRVFYNPHDLTQIWVTSFGNGLKYGFAPSEPLAIHHNDFIGKAKEGFNQLTWRIEQSHLIQYGHLERSQDGHHYSEIHQFLIKPESDYLYQDYLYFQYSYYRLAFTSIHGHKFYSNVISVKRDDKFNPVLQVSPSIVNDQFQVDINSVSDRPGSIKIIDGLGQTVLVKELQTTRPNLRLAFDLSLFKPGIYFVHFTNSNGVTASTRILKN